MESAQTTITVLRLNGDVINIEQVIGKRYRSGVGQEAKFDEYTEGWRVRFSMFGGAFSIMFNEEPDLKVGPISMTIEPKDWRRNA